MTGKGAGRRAAEIGPKRERGCGQRDRHERNRTMTNAREAEIDGRRNQDGGIREEVNLLGELPCRRVGICFHHLQDSRGRGRLDPHLYQILN